MVHCFITYSRNILRVVFSASTLLDGQQEGHPACRKRAPLEIHYGPSLADLRGIWSYLEWSPEKTGQL